MEAIDIKKQLDAHEVQCNQRHEETRDGFATVNREIVSINKEIGTIRGNIGTEIGGVKGEIGALKGEVRAVKEKLDASDRRLDALEENIGAAREEIKDIRKDIVALEKEMERTRGLIYGLYVLIAFLSTAAGGTLLWMANTLIDLTEAVASLS